MISNLRTLYFTLNILWMNIAAQLRRVCIHVGECAVLLIAGLRISV